MTIIFGELHRFNTGNRYTVNGQPITWAVFEKDHVKGIIFQDHARGITKAIPLPGRHGFTMREGVKSTFMLNGPIDDIYVKQCERAGAFHETLGQDWELTSKFWKLTASK